MLASAAYDKERNMAKGGGGGGDRGSANENIIMDNYDDESGGGGNLFGDGFASFFKNKKDGDGVKR